MDAGRPGHRAIIGPNLTILDIIARFRQTEAVFREYDKQAGVCLCCEALFSSLEEVASKYDLDLNELIASLEKAARTSAGGNETISAARA